MNYFDLHADTPYEMYKKHRGFRENDLHISAVKASAFSKYFQIFAVWTENALSNGAAWEQFPLILHNFETEARMCGYVKCLDFSDLERAERSGGRGYFISVEGARLLDLKLERLATLYSEGVRVLTLQWKGADCVGSAFDAVGGLKSFGRETVAAAAELGMILDISHSNTETARECISIASLHGGKVIASHSDSYSLCGHPRNISDSLAQDIKNAGGVVGVSLVPFHLSEGGGADTGSVIGHIRHFIDIGIGDSLSLGCDFDGISETPAGIKDISSVPLIYEALISSGVSREAADGIFYGNARAFIKRALG